MTTAGAQNLSCKMRGLRFRVQIVGLERWAQICLLLLLVIVELVEFQSQGYHPNLDFEVSDNQAYMLGSSQNPASLQPFLSPASTRSPPVLTNSPVA